MFAELDAALVAREQAGLLRVRKTVTHISGARVEVDGVAQLGFASNDYLGLAGDLRLREAAQAATPDFGLGSGASHLVSGHSALHATLEQQLSDWLGQPCLLFTTGYMASVGAIPALVGRGDAIFGDKLNHASLHDGCVLSGAAFKRYRHQDLAHLAQLLETTPARRRLIVVDGVFSMDGDIAPLPALLALAEQFDALLYVDDAHAVGILGQGKGTAAHWGLQSPRLIQLLTFGKAAGGLGAAIVAEPVIIQTLLQTARTYIYTTALPPLLAAALSCSVAIMQSSEGAAKRAVLQQHIAQLQAGVSGLPWRLLPSQTPIQPLWVGTGAAAIALSESLWARGVWVPAIRPPTVPVGQARLRISLSAAHTAADIACLLDALHASAKVLQ